MPALAGGGPEAVSWEFVPSWGWGHHSLLLWLKGQWEVALGDCQALLWVAELGGCSHREALSGCVFKADFVLSSVWPDRQQCPGAVAGAGEPGGSLEESPCLSYSSFMAQCLGSVLL